MSGVKTENVTNRVLFLGDNYFHSVEIYVAPGATIPAGAVLRRDPSNAAVLIPAINTADFSAVNPFEIKNETAEGKRFSARVIVAGRVRMDMLTIDGAPFGAGSIDKLRKVGILPVKVTDLSKLDNQ